ncbi:MAG: hypothetical protein HFE73_11320 [Firmicutes bacterium]|nr:hypothetical protein [Bacillota bacterium]
MPEHFNEVGAARLFRMSREGVWQCELVRFPEPVRQEPEDTPYYPGMMMAVDSQREYLVQTKLVRNYEKEPVLLLNGFIDAFLEEGICPAQIWARDQRTYRLLSMFCSKMQIPIEVTRSLPELDRVQEMFFALLYHIKAGKRDNTAE